MKEERPQYLLDCSHVETPEELWSLYLEQVEPEERPAFGHDLDALRDALRAGAPGSPGPCFLEIRNIERLESRHPSFVRALEEVGRELREVHADVDLAVIRFLAAPGAPRGRLYQHERFITRELEGATIEQLLSWTPRPPESEMVWLKLRGRPWQRFFLEAGLTFWDEYDEREAFEAFEDVRHEILDVGVEHRLVGRQLGIVQARGNGEGWCLEIAVHPGGVLRLEAEEPCNFESRIHLRYHDAP